MKLSVSPRAARDLESIGDYIARDNPPRAVTFVREIRQQFLAIARRPAAFQVREDLAPGVRMSVHGSYLIFFRIMGKVVRVERGIHGARNLLRGGGLDSLQ